MAGRPCTSNRVSGTHGPALAALRFFIGGLVVLASSCVLDGVRSPPASAPARSASSSLPPLWTSAEREAARQAILQGVDPGSLDPSPTIGALGPVIYSPVPGRTEMDTDTFIRRYDDSHEIAPGAVGDRVEVHQSWLARGPAAAIEEDGQLLVRFEALRPVGPVELGLGFEIWGPRLFEPVYRHVVRSPAQPRQSFALSYSLARLVRRKYDVTEVRRTGRGVVAYRLQVLDAERYTTQVEDGRVAFRCKPPCGPGDEFVQLPTVVLGPFVDQVTPRSAVISFETDVPTLAAVQLKDATEGPPRWIRSTEGGRRHEIAVDGLNPGASYRYLAVAVDRRSETVAVPYGTFRTPPAAAKAFRFAVMSDSRSAAGGDGRNYNGVNRHVLERLMQQAVSRKVDFVVFAGDLVDGYNTLPSEFRRQLRAWMETVAPFHMHMPIYEVMGNHELVGDAWSEGWMADRNASDNSETLFAAAVVNPRNGPPAEPNMPPYLESVYSFDFGSAHFAVVNSNHWHRNRFERTDHPALPRGQREGTLNDTQLAWLDRDLTEARQRGLRHLFVFTHEPSFPTGGHVHDAMYYEGKIPEVLAVRDRFWGILVKHGVVAAFFGDEHNYSRTLIDDKVDPKYTRPVWNIVTGGAGAPYYARDFSVPWADAVQAFKPDHHFVEVAIDGPEVRLQARNLRAEVIDEAVLTAAAGVE